MTMTLEAAVAGFLVPAAVAGFILLGFRFLGAAAPLGGAIALAAAFLAAWALFGWTPWRPEDSWHWLPELALLGAAAAVAEHLAARAPWTWLVRLAAAVLAGGLLVPTLETYEEVLKHLHLWRAAAGGSIFLLWCFLAWLGKRLPPGVLPGILAICSLGAALFEGLADIAKFGQLAGVVAAAMLMAAATDWPRPAGPRAASMLGGWAILFAGLLFQGAFNTYTAPLPLFFLVLAAPLPAACLALPPLSRMGRPAKLLAGALAALVPIALAVGRLLLTVEEW